MYFGVDYYPEHWPKERWPQDAKMMKEAHINVVRLAEFAWAKMEPEEGRYDFAWLDEAIEVLTAEGIQIILGTPTAAPPKWLMDLYPDAYPSDVFGLTKGFGTRRHYCPNHKVYRDYSRTIAHRMAEHFKDHPHVIAWQIDNEFGGPCYCHSCLKAFRLWLRNRYKDIGNLNREWGTVFWSQTYRDWEEVIVPTYSASDGFSQNAASGVFVSAPYNHNPGLVLDYFRFYTDAVTEYQRIQIDEIRACTDKPITHNLMGHYSELDYFKLGKDLDFICWDNYPNNMWGKSSWSNVSMAHDLMRGIKNQNFWMMEEQSGPCGWQMLGDTPEPGQVRLWTYQAIAHGAEAMVYFRWRACTVGIEQYWYGILDHDGIGRRRYREIQQIGAEMEQLSQLFVGSENVSSVALIKSYDNFWSHRGQPHNVKFQYNGLLSDYYQAVAAHHVNLDVTAVESDFSSYKLVMMPAFNLVTEEIADKCKAYVEGGGTLLLTFRSGTKTWSNRMTELTVPGLFRELAGVELEEFDSLNNGRTVLVQGDFGQGTASIWCDVLTLTGAQVLATYGSHFYKGQPAITVNNYGKGRVIYVGCDLDEKAMELLMKQILQEEGIAPLLQEKTDGVEAVAKMNDGVSYLMLLNHLGQQAITRLDGAYTDAFTGAAMEENVNIPPYGVRVLIKGETRRSFT
ncbi:beta-galactosidase [Paenibacillus roseipurpureus]|uniref:Beta-galactosidase n=1 Tax=Paenibacillus roseopurpureus TaxID=2918901 RepID=A0AA96LJI5_9BACL|nr:beta-galactosidase [Paenibacillus sp. MBLB1832]WNR42900.1 beta-galactosidase [Paenibacillus sp. MBLB1832]